MPTHHVVWLVGPAGVGKTSVLRALALPSDYQTDDTEVRWTTKGDTAFIGHYENKILDGGDRVARHANLLCMEYWKRNILPDPRFRVTVLDGEMYLWKRIREPICNQTFDFQTAEDPHYQPEGRYHTTFAQIRNADLERFPQSLLQPSSDLPQVQAHCIYLKASDEVSLQRRRGRESNAEEGATINSDRHLRIASSKQRNFAALFEDADTPFFMEPEESPQGYLALDTENMSAAQVLSAVRSYLEGLES